MYWAFLKNLKLCQFPVLRKEKKKSRDDWLVTGSSQAADIDTCADIVDR